MRFFPDTTPTPPVDDPGNPRQAGDKIDDNSTRLQYAYKLDTNIVDPLGALPLNVLPTSATLGGLLTEVADTIAPRIIPATHPPAPDRPSLALLNLLRGNRYGLAGGQAVVLALQTGGLPEATALTAPQLVVRTFVEQKNDTTPGNEANQVNFYKFVPIDPALQEDTPLWFYVLAEAQAPLLDVSAFQNGQEFSETLLLNGPGARTQLGWVGGRIVTEVFFGLLDSDPESVVNAAPAGWRPMLGGDGQPIFLNLVKFVEMP